MAILLYATRCIHITDIVHRLFFPLHLLIVNSAVQRRHPIGTLRTSIMSGNAHGHQECLSELITRFRERLDLDGCIARVGPFTGHLLDNEIMPMFGIKRWATGPDQLDEHSYHRLRRALQLATLFLTEDCTLGWFTRYTFGRRKATSSGQTYISSTKHTESKEARNQVKRNLRALGKSLTLMYRPAFGERGGDYGATYSSKRFLPFFRYFKESDWPDTVEDGRRHPVIVFHNDFFQYFSKSLWNAVPEIWIRMQFLFATTLVHEVTHAYSMWLGIDRDEPLFREEDKEAELGFSWETEVLGYICNPHLHSITGCDMLLSMKAVSYTDDRSQPAIVRRLIGNHPLHFNRMNPGHFRDLFQLQGYRGGNFYSGERFDSHRKWVIAIYALNLQWIASWFDQSSWKARRFDWRNSGRYVPKPLESFVLVYQKKGGVVWVHYPLDPRIEEDVAWIPLAAELERRRGGNKLPCIG
jgi:hypothetical protein